MALPSKIALEIVTPDRILVTALVDELMLPGTEGYFGVLPGHTPMLSTLHVGEMWYRVDQEKHFLAIAFGFVEVLPDRVTVLARIAERAEEIDAERAEAAKVRAEARLAEQRTDVDFERARVALLKSLVRLQVAGRARTRA
jgi:F-type H+-transporting ATPase subunit epsilon